MQVRRDKKMPLALYIDSEPAIISQAYPVFEINDISQLLPEYLMMWFTRSEFDREACFHAVGGVRGSLEWEDFENLQLPIPHPDKQREIVKEHMRANAMDRFIIFCLLVLFRFIIRRQSKQKIAKFPTKYYF